MKKRRGYGDMPSPYLPTKEEALPYVLFQSGDKIGKMEQQI